MTKNKYSNNKILLIRPTRRVLITPRSQTNKRGKQVFWKFVEPIEKLILLQTTLQHGKPTERNNDCFAMFSLYIYITIQ